MKIIIIKFPSGNVQSLLFSLERIGVNAEVSNYEEHIKSADKVILPGVGEAGFAMKYLKKNKLNDIIFNLKQPVLGICLGMQLLCKFSEESNTECIGIFNYLVKKFKSKKYKIPKMGWNTISDLSGPLFKNISNGSYQYFVHGYYIPLGIHTIAKTEYIVNYSAALQKKNFYAVQFHPEKSSYVGHKILENFIQL
ncbi:imidazole glycerol phosphate synthase subunit HisH [Blattabacterium cuenoti]|uniref:imidazole glycerol phosphate synthase subunit HisH n=1 Tax=Blattabacterium cuenoti TaxID=1653831 RepID=UPI00163B6AF8|nr:imidazole glycerol phosphate synthase subunit HisH [Blattabacterium cuenoti]